MQREQKNNKKNTRQSAKLYSHRWRVKHRGAMRGRAERGRETDEVNERETLVEKRERKFKLENES